MDLVGGLERTLQGKVKPSTCYLTLSLVNLQTDLTLTIFQVVTQCEMRRLYSAQPKDEDLIDQAKKYERRRCNHHELEEPLSTLECFSEVVGLTNKHRYVISSQDAKVRGQMRRIPGVPLVYINRSVMILEPMSTTTEDLRDQDEKSKLRAGFKGRRGVDTSQKRKRDNEIGEHGSHDTISETLSDRSIRTTDAMSQKKKQKKGSKEPNPLSMKKPKSRTLPATEERPALSNGSASMNGIELARAVDTDTAHDETVEPTKRKRKRKHKSHADSGSDPMGEELADVS